jgi:hypothetical protein
VADAHEDRVEHPIGPVRATLDRGRMTPLLWAAGLALVVAVAVAGQRPAEGPRIAVARRSLPAVAAHIAAADATPDLSPLPWDTSRRWAEDTLVRGVAPPWLDRPFGTTFARVRSRLGAPLAR